MYRPFEIGEAVSYEHPVHGFMLVTIKQLNRPYHYQSAIVETDDGRMISVNLSSCKHL